MTLDILKEVFISVTGPDGLAVFLTRISFLIIFTPLAYFLGKMTKKFKTYESKTIMDLISIFLQFNLFINVGSHGGCFFPLPAIILIFSKSEWVSINHNLNLSGIVLLLQLVLSVVLYMRGKENKGFIFNNIKLINLVSTHYKIKIYFYTSYFLLLLLTFFMYNKHYEFKPMLHTIPLLVLFILCDFVVHFSNKIQK